MIFRLLHARCLVFNNSVVFVTDLKINVNLNVFTFLQTKRWFLVSVGAVLVAEQEISANLVALCLLQTFSRQRTSSSTLEFRHFHNFCSTYPEIRSSSEPGELRVHHEEMKSFHMPKSCLNCSYSYIHTALVVRSICVPQKVGINKKDTNKNDISIRNKELL